MTSLTPSRDRAVGIALLVASLVALLGGLVLLGWPQVDREPEGEVSRSDARLVCPSGTLVERTMGALLATEPAVSGRAELDAAGAALVRHEPDLRGRALAYVDALDAWDDAVEVRGRASDLSIEREAVRRAAIELATASVSFCADP